MYTQCPKCKTVYRLHIEQLNAARGQVRCSRCQTTFDALDNLFEYREEGDADETLPQQSDSFSSSARASYAAESSDLIENTIEEILAKEPIPVTEPQPKPAPKPQPKPESRPQPKPEPRPQPKPETKLQPKPEPRPQPKPETKLQPKPESRLQPKPETRPQPKPGSRPQPKPETKPQPKPAPKPQPKPEPRPQPKPAPKPQPKPETKPQPKPETRPQPKPETRPQPKPAPKPQPKPAPKPQPKPAPKPQPKPESRPKPKPDTKPQPKPETKPQPRPEPKLQPQSPEALTLSSDDDLQFDDLLSLIDDLPGFSDSPALSESDEKKATAKAESEAIIRKNGTEPHSEARPTNESAEEKSSAGEETGRPTPEDSDKPGSEESEYVEEIELGTAPAIEESVAPENSGYALPPELEQTARRNGFLSFLLWGSGIVLMLAGLVLQYIYYHRSVMAENPEIRPVLEQMCRITGCRLPPLRDLSAIQLGDHLVQSHPRYENSLLITATLLNRADYVQPYPILEVVMTDLSQKEIARRRFLPQEYLIGDSDTLAFKPGNEVPLMLEVVDPGKQAVGFEFNFY